MPGSPESGPYTFTVTSENRKGSATDTQLDLYTLPIMDMRTFTPAAGELITMKVPHFSWRAMDADVPLYYRVDIKDVKDKYIYRTSYVKDMSSVRLLPDIFEVGKTYLWRVRVIDALWAWGHGGQFIFVLPELDLVVVFTAKHRDNPGYSDCAFNMLTNYIIPAVIPSGPPRNMVKAPLEALETYVGTYRFKHDQGTEIINIFIKDKKLYGKSDDKDIAELYPEFENQFFGTSNVIGGFKLQFIKDQEGDVANFLFQFAHQFSPYKNLNPTDWYTSKVAGDIEVSFVPATHFAGRGFFDQRESLWGGYIFKSTGKAIYFAGDTGYSELFSDIQERYGAMDVCLMPISAYFSGRFTLHLRMRCRRLKISAARPLYPGVMEPLSWDMNMCKNRFGDWKKRKVA